MLIRTGSQSCSSWSACTVGVNKSSVLLTGGVSVAVLLLGRVRCGLGQCHLEPTVQPLLLSSTSTQLPSCNPSCAVGTVVECSPGERLSLPPQLPHTPAASALVAAAVPRVELWCNDNSLGTFYAGTASQPFPEHSFDLRSPLGVTPAALLAMGAAEEVAWAAPKQQLAEAAAGPSPGAAAAAEGGRPQDVQQQQAQQAQQPSKVASLRKQKDAGEMFRRFESSRRHLQTESAARLVTPSGGRECGSM